MIRGSRTGIVAVALALGAVIAPQVVAAEPESAVVDRGEAVVAAIESYNEQVLGVALPVPSGKDLESLLDGEVVRFRTKVPIEDRRTEDDFHVRVVGYLLVELPRLDLWLAALDPGVRHSDRLSEVMVSSDGHGGALWYQHLRLPWPVRNRQWVVRTAKRPEVEDVTAGRVWEHSWKLAEGGEEIAREVLARGSVDGLDPDKARKAIYVSVNRGAWTMFDLGGDVTPMAYRVTTVMGGWIPESWVARFASRQLNGLLTGVVARAPEARTNHVTNDLPVWDGAGRAIDLDAGEPAGGR